MMDRLSLAGRYVLGGLLFLGFEITLIAFIDKPLSLYLRTVDEQHHVLVDFFRIWTDLGKSKWYLWPSGIGALFCFGLSFWDKLSSQRRRRLQRTGQMLGFFFCCVAISGLVTDIFKSIIGRARPVELARNGFYGFDSFSFHKNYDTFNSLPSGHATTAFAVAFALIALQSRWRPYLIVFAVALGLSRIVVNAHYLSDVLAGALVGTLTALALQNLFQRRGWIAPSVAPGDKG